MPKKVSPKKAIKKIKCHTCNKLFTPRDFQINHIKESKQKGCRIISLNCSLCKGDIAYDPINEKSINMYAKEEELVYRCPIARCTGWVSYASEESDEKSFWGCGECGSIWYNRENLFGEISDIVKKYKYRRKCYIKQKQEWKPADLDKEHKDYEDLVVEEEQDKKESYKRD